MLVVSWMSYTIAIAWYYRDFSFAAAFVSSRRSASGRFEISTRYKFRPCLLPLTSIGKAAHDTNLSSYTYVYMYVRIYLFSYHVIASIAVSYNFLFRPYWLFAAISEIHFLESISSPTNIEKSDMSNESPQLICYFKLQRVSICRILCQIFTIINSITRINDLEIPKIAAVSLAESSRCTVSPSQCNWCGGNSRSRIDA